MTARTWFTVGAAAAGVVAVVFATVGDGVAVDDATGVRKVVVDHAHTLVWVLLALALGAAAVAGRWTALSQVLAAAAGITYGTFLLSVFVLR